MPTLIVNGPPPSNAINVTYDETPNSPREACQSNVFKSVRTFIVPWTQRWSFCAGMMGWPTLTLDALGFPWVSRVVPQGYPARDLDGSLTKWLYPNSIEGVVGKGKITSYDADGVAQYSKAEISLGYETLTYKVVDDATVFAFANLIDGELTSSAPLNPWNPNFTIPLLTPGVNGIEESALIRYITKFRQPTAEYLTLPFGGMNWIGTTPLTPCPGSIGKIVSSQEVMYIWHQTPNVPDAVKTAMGTVNSTPFDIYPRGTLLLTSIEVKPYRWFFNTKIYDITYKMKYFQPIQTGNNPPLIDNTLDNGAPPIALGEYFGHNHFLRYQNLAGGGGAPLLPAYQMLSHNAVGPRFGGETVYKYTDFSKLFQPTTAVLPPE